MKKTLCFLTLLTAGLTWASAQDATSLQVAPSDTVKYPDASQILNKTEPLPPTAPAATVPSKPLGLPTAKPLVASPPVAAATKAASKPASPVPETEHGWFLKWTLKGTEDGALGWTQALGLPASLHPLSEGLWEVWAGPLDSTALKDALSGQGGVAVLVRR